MSLSRTASAAMVIATAMPWAVLMSVGGAWLLANGSSGMGPLVGPEQGPMHGVLKTGGVFWLAAGQLLFMSLVADRLFPRASRRLVAPLEVATSLALFGCVVWIVVLLGRMLAMQGGM